MVLKQVLQYCSVVQVTLALALTICNLLQWMIISLPQHWTFVAFLLPVLKVLSLNSKMPRLPVLFGYGLASCAMTIWCAYIIINATFLADFPDGGLALLIFFFGICTAGGAYFSLLLYKVYKLPNQRSN